MGRCGQEDQEFEVILSYITNTRPASKTKNKKRRVDGKEETGRKERKNHHPRAMGPGFSSQQRESRNRRGA